MPEPVPSLSVSDVNRLIKTTLQDTDGLKNIWVKGEISNFSQTASSGHMYFSLKDQASVIKCAFFSFQAKNYKGRPLKNGMEVNLFGSISVYEPGGYYSISVQKIEELGQGDILLQIERLKASLLEKGIFDPTRKKPLPKYPKRLGIVTSPKGAAVEDIIRIATDLNPSIQILVSPCLVQGDEAAASISGAIRALNDPKWEVDVIIAGRGGGSFEDLMAFNTEEVVMAYYHSKIPIISAVGHEIDRVLTDLSADASAPTPTAAAKLAIPNVSEVLVKMEEVEDRLRFALKNRTNIGREKLIGISSRTFFQNPYVILETRSIAVDEIMNRLSLLGKNFLMQKKTDFAKTEILKIRMEQYTKQKRKELELTQSRVENFSPLGTLKRGYSVLRNHKKEVISSIDQIQTKEKLEIILSQGRLNIEVIDKIKE
ncbi:exodeoxyribonuclease VII large subunit [Leptospira ilyithenensis]|uniref:Exodeoxyribonuclease 7 large subunit n=1 Tax=Leptospira ilyithenensis TaxID=2484901 RepID=A0A4V6QMS2_9LEPT|nr:exodeoxyribonuclease VII large subunit [Leptospira ilyithenensis]TGN08438.1 exodeoxyribonuclease VII large subunit [Leptospira ilyithenensis]